MLELLNRLELLWKEKWSLHLFQDPSSKEGETKIAEMVLGWVGIE